MSNDDDDDDEDACFADMGFMFEGAEPSILEKFEWTKGDRIVKVTLKRADGDPGAVQSGHYLWPAAPALAEHLLERKETPTTILELGSGCALLSLTALQVFSNLQCLVTTDHDPGTLDRAKENHEITCEEVFADHRLLEQIISVPIVWELLSWGDEDDAINILKTLQSTINQADAKFDMILGSDLIYDVDVAKPLLLTVAALMNKKNHARFIMSQSFPYDDRTETVIDNVCASLGLQRTKIADNLHQEGGVRIQEYHWK